MVIKSLLAFKKNFVNIFISGALLTFLSFFFLYFIRLKFKSYIIQLDQYMPELQNLQQGLNSGNLMPGDAGSLLNQLSSVTNQALILGYFVVPAAIFILFIIFESIIFKQFKDGHMKNYLKYLKNFALVGIIIYVAALVIAYNIFLNMKSLFGGFNIMLLFLIISGLVLAYLSLIWLSLIEEGKNAFKTFKHAFYIGVKKPLTLAPLALVLCFFALIFLLFFSAIFTTFNLGNSFLFPTWGNVLAILILLVIILYMKNMFYLLVKKYSTV